MADFIPGPRLFPEDHAREILSSRCGGEVLQVLDDSEHRWLKYRNGVLQSAMNKRHPERLVLPYTRAMASVLLFVTNPKLVLILGLGGGSLVRFFLNYYPTAQLTVVERETNCVSIAQELFCLPAGHAGLELVPGDARDVVPVLRGPYDLVMLDLFLAHGPPRWLGLPDLFDACRSRMTDTGVISANMWVDPDDEQSAVLRGMTAAFGGKLLLVPVSGFRNVIVHAFCAKHQPPDLTALRARGRALSEILGIDMNAWLRIIEGANAVENLRLAL